MYILFRKNKIYIIIYIYVRVTSITRKIFQRNTKKRKKRKK